MIIVSLRLKKWWKNRSGWYHGFPTEPSSSLETQGLLAGTMRYFRGKVYFKSWRAPGNLLLPNQFQKWSNSVPLIGQNGQSAKSSSRVTLSPSYTKQFSSSIDLVAWPVQRAKQLGNTKQHDFYLKLSWKVSDKNHDSTKPRKSQGLTWG